MTQAIQTLLEQLKTLKKKDDWLGIYNKFQPIAELDQNDLIWNSPEVLSDLGFACAKLAETSPSEIPKDPKDKKDFLKQQAGYRKHAERIRKRCIELKPKDPTYRSNLAYTYYQNINELTQPRGRRDGNLMKEIENFRTAVDEGLALNPKRVNDLYRKGYVLTKVLPNQILWGKLNEDFAEKSKKANEVREEGIQTLLSAKVKWENLGPDEEFWRKKYRKDYIKSLYALSRAYYDKIKQDWDASVFALNLRDDVPANWKVTIEQGDKENIEQAIQMIKECCLADCPSDIKQGSSNLEKIAAHPSEHEGVDKLYSIGKLFFAKYWILSGYGLKETNEAIEARETTERYLKMALKCKWSPQKAKQPKLFVAERLARSYISKKEYDQASTIIAEHTKNLKLESAASYILHTSALGLLKSGKIEGVQKFLDAAAESNSNKDPWLTHFLKGCAYLESNQIEHAQEHLDIAHQKAEQVGKKNVDSLLIAKGFVACKSRNVSEALKFMEEAQRLNPNRVSVGERIRKWKQSEA